MNGSFFQGFTNEEVFEMMCLRAGREGRDDRLFGGLGRRATSLIRPFIIGRSFPIVFWEFPLKGDPYLDISVLYKTLSEEDFVASPYATGCEKLIPVYSRMRREHHDICFGFELDTSKKDPGLAAVHFEPRQHTELVGPFCGSIGEDAYGRLYLRMASKLSDVIPPSFFGMFRGRPDAPLRICGYMGQEETAAIAGGSDILIKLFRTVGFTAYDGQMLDDIREFLGLAPFAADYQFDIYPDETAGDVFSIDVRLFASTKNSVRESFERGAAASAMSFFRKRGIADERSDLISGMAASFAFPVQDESDGIFGQAMILHPMWLKIRWKDSRLQNAKCYSVLKSYRI